MRLISLLMTILALTFALPAASRADTRALLVACSDFITQPDLGSAISGNVQMIASALLGVSPRLSGLSIEDGTIGSGEALSSAIADTFSAADEDDLSILYLCTHGLLSSSDDGLSYLLLSDGETETALSGEALCTMLAPIQGDKLLILDACFSGALIGRGAQRRPGQGEPPEPHSASPAQTAALAARPFLSDTSIHVLTSAGAHESSWYYDSSHLSTGAVSYFASALASGLGLYGAAEADINGDAQITLEEMHRYLSAAVPSSSCQLLSADAQLALPALQSAMLTRPLSGFTYGQTLLDAAAPEVSFSFTVGEETAVQYRLIDYEDGGWNWENAKTFLDAGDTGSGALSPGRKTRTLTLSGLTPQDSGYLMLQVFSLSDAGLILCSERLIAVQGETDAGMTVCAPARFVPGEAEMPVDIMTGVPAEITVTVRDESGALIRRLCRGDMTRPAPGGLTRLYWDGRADNGAFAPAGRYEITAEAVIGGRRVKAAAGLTIP